MILKKPIVLLFIFSLIAAALTVSAGVTSNQTFSGAAKWIKHPGVAVGKLFASSALMITVVGDGNGTLHAWNPSGVEIAGFPIALPNRSTIPIGGFHREYNDFVNSTPALVDISGDAGLEIFVGCGDGWLYGYNNLGAALTGWPKFTGVSLGDGNYGVHSSPAVADIDNDGNFEVIVGSFSHLIWVWNAENGTVYPGWPFDNADTVWSSPAVADLNRDGTLEIVIGCDSTVPAGGLLRVFQYTGEQMSGWPQNLDQILQSSPAIGDIDNDGLLEIVVGTGLFYPGSAPATQHPGEYVSAYEANGSKVTGWPVSLADGNLSTDNRVYSSPALADIDANGTLETFVGDMFGFLHCINSNGTIRWSQTPQVGNSASFAFLSSPVVGDIDGDGTMDVVIGGGFHLNAFNAATGALKYSIYTGEGVVPLPPVFTFGTPTIADVDGDGLIELLIGTGRENNAAAPANIGFVKVYHETGTAGAPPAGQTGVSQSVAPWARFHRSNRGTGSTNDLPASTGGSALISAATANPFVFSPNGDGIADTETIQFTLASTDTITVDILDRTGTIIAVPLNASSRNAGTHNVSWNGNNSTGALAIDGMYTFRIRGNSAAPVLGSFGLNNTVPEASTSWFLAEGSTVNFEAYILVQNPNFSPVTVDFTFFRQNGTTKLHSEVVSARTRITVPIHDPVKGVPGVFSVSTQVQASAPILVERAMYFNGNQGAHNTIGVTSLSRTWHFPANRAFSGDEDFILIVNPSTSATATVTGTFIQEGLAPQVQNYSVGPNSRFTIAVHGAIAAGTRASVTLQSTLPIAAERALYVGSRAGGAAGIGAVSASQTWYFAEGDTSNLYSPTTIAAATFLEMFNPGDLVATVTVNYMLEGGTVISRTHFIDAKRRLTLDLANSADQVGPNQRFSIEVLSNNPIVAERIMFSGSDVGDTIGSPTTAYVWNLAEGFTAFGFETWVIVNNPGSQTANITMDFLKQNGTTVTENYTLLPKRRLTVHVNTVPNIPGTSVSTQVTSDQPIVVERTMRFSNRLGMHQAMGVRQ